ncbi:hypothetical protein CEQ90_17915 [Lewinellaceae bacterium SD302]|nr:hypothetical protein CEQ90_17915 [Lewinellaceae bacterium SD302]
MLTRNDSFPLLLLLGLTLPAFIYGQSQLDSLKTVYLEQRDSEQRLITLFEILDNSPDLTTDSTELNGWITEGERLIGQYPDLPVSLDYYLYRNDLAIQRANYEVSYVYGLKAIDLAQQLGRPKQQAVAAYGTAFALSEYDPESSLSFYRQCIKLSRQTGDSTTLADCLIDYSDAYSLAGEYNDTVYLKLITEALTISAALGLGEQRTTNYIHHILYYLEQGDLKMAESFLPPLRRISDSLAEFEDRLFALIPLDMEAVILQASGQYEAALPLAKEVLDTMLAHKLYANADQHYETIIELYELTGRYQEGFQQLQRYLDYREDIFATDKRMLVSQLNEQYRTAEKEKLIEAQQSELAQVNQRYLLLGGAALLFGGLLILLIHQSNKVKRSNAALSSLSAEISAQNDRLNILLGELHHRVKNNLQLISSLLRLQARKTSDQSVKSALSVGQRRVEAMSIIHQRLYQQENLTVVDLQSVFSELVQRTDFAYRPGLTPIQANIQLDVRHLDATHAVPLTLIVNELVTNSFKYAFGELSTPGITMSLSCLPSGKLCFGYSDNGPGFQVGSQPTAGFGTQLIHSLSGQLGGSNEFKSDEQGAHFELIFRASTPRTEDDHRR